MKIITVAPFKGGIKKELTYFSKTEIPLGSIVSVPILKKETDALVVDIKDLREYKSAVKISDFSFKKIKEIKGKPFWSEEFFRAILRAQKYFARPLGELIEAFIPKSFLDNHDKLATEQGKNIQTKDNLKSEKLALQLPIEERLDFYKTFIRQSFAKKSSIIFCLPRISDVKYFSEKLSTGLEQYSFALHSEFPSKKQLESYKKIMSIDHPVIVFCTASFLSIPRKDLGALIIEKESSPAWEAISSSIDNKTFAEILTQELNIKIIFADTLLSLKTVERHNQGELNELLPLKFRLTQMPEIIKQEDTSILEVTTFRMIQQSLTGQAFLFALRKGLATFTVCHDCKSVHTCQKCDKPLVLHEKLKKIFVCHNCKKEEEAETKCKNCQSWNLIPLGFGQEAVYEEIKKDFPNRKVILFKKEKDLKGFFETPGAILIGGENALNNLPQKVQNGAIISFDTLFNIPDYEMNEKIVRIVSELCEKTEKKIIIQTKRDFELKENLLDFVREELVLRKKYNYPPFVRFIELIFPLNKLGRKILTEFEDLAPEEWLEGKKMKLILKVPIAEWNIKSVNQELLEKLMKLPPSVLVRVI